MVLTVPWNGRSALLKPVSAGRVAWLVLHSQAAAVQCDAGFARIWVTRPGMMAR